MTPAVRVGDTVHVGKHDDEEVFEILRRIPREEIKSVDEDSIQIGSTDSKHFYPKTTLSEWTSKRARKRSIEEADDILAMVLDGYTLTEARVICEASRAVMGSIHRSDPESLVWHPVNQQAKKSKFGYNDDLDPKTRDMFSDPPSGGRIVTPDRKLIQARLVPQFSPRKKAPSPTGGRIKRPHPNISNDHLDFLVQAAKSEHEGAHWYEHVHPLVSHILDRGPYKDSHMFVGLLAAGSPQTHPHLNVVKALRAYRDIVQGRPLVGPKGETDNYLRAAHGIQLSGPKVHPYNRNMMGQRDFNTNDRHMKYVVLGNINSEANIHPEHHAAITQVVRHVADKLGWPIAHAQSALWHHDIRRMGLNHPSFHEPNSPFRNYSTKYGGWLEPTEHEHQVQDYGQYILHNIDAITKIKGEMDKFRLDHPVHSKHANSGVPFFLDPHIGGSAARYGKEIHPIEYDSALGKVGDAMVDLKGRDKTALDTETGWPVKPRVLAKKTGKASKPKLVKASFLAGS